MDHMPFDDQEPQAADTVWRDLAACERASEAWLLLVMRSADQSELWPGASWCREAQTRLERCLWHLHRAEDGFVLWRPLADLAVNAAPSPRPDDAFPLWRERLDRIVAQRGIATAYRTVMHPLDPDDEAVGVDAVTDLALVCACAHAAHGDLQTIAQRRDRGALDRLAFTRVLAPWRNQGAPAAIRALAWLQAMRIDEDAW